MQPRTFNYREHDAVGTIELNRPDRLNALTFEVYAELRNFFPWVAEQPRVKALVLTGRGRGFCSGGDVDAIIGELLGKGAEDLLRFTRMTGALVKNIRACPKPVVAAINGIAAGAGAVIALACDFRVGCEHSRFAFLFTKVGLAGADMGAAYLLPRVVGLAHATELLMLGDTVKAGDAQRIGLLNRVVAPDEVVAEAERLARQLAQGPSFALGVTKALLNHELDIDFAAAIEAEAEAQALCMQTRNFREAYEAFVARRPPSFE
jgi:enoyl-CoA hydratase/carnithine racemase